MKKAFIILVALLIVLGGLTLGVIPASAGDGPAVDPVLEPGNPTCEDLGYEAGFKPQPEPPPDGSYPIPGDLGEITITNLETGVVSWSSTFGIDAVIVKGGPDANAYVYDSESFGDTSLSTPINPNNDEPFEISHVDFCYDVEPPAKPVHAILECVIDHYDGSYTAYFGYLNENEAAVEIPAGGENNYFTPVPKDRGQPSVFEPGRTPYYPDAAFSVDFDGSNLVWTLKGPDGSGRTSTASANSERCPDQPPPPERLPEPSFSSCYVPPNDKTGEEGSFTLTVVNNGGAGSIGYGVAGEQGILELGYFEAGETRVFEGIVLLNDDPDLLRIYVQKVVGGDSWVRAPGELLLDPATATLCDEKPSAIDLAAYDLTVNSGQVLITWETATELDNAGFNIYRSTSPAGPFVKVNDELILANGDFMTGGSYAFIDRPGRGNFFYQLEDIDLYGVATRHDLFQAELGPAIRTPLFRPTVPD